MGAAVLHHRRREGHGGLEQGLETQPAVRANNDPDLIPFSPAGMTQAISGAWHR